MRQQQKAGEGEAWYVSFRGPPVITGRDLRNARPTQGEFGKWETMFTLKSGCRQALWPFHRIAHRQKIGDRTGQSDPQRLQPFRTGSRTVAELPGANDQQEASDLALVLRAGSLPAGVVPLQEQTVGPSLGADSIPRRG